MSIVVLNPKHWHWQDYWPPNYTPSWQTYTQAHALTGIYAYAALLLATISITIVLYRVLVFGKPSLRHKRAYSLHGIETRGFPLRLPPGPRRLPVIGNVFDFPKSEEWVKAKEWAAKYGDLIYLEALGQKVLFVTSYEDSYELLDRQSLNYSSRPYIPMLHDLMAWDWTVTIMPYGDRLRKARSFYHRFLQPREVGAYAELQASECRKMVRRMIEDPDGFFDHVKLAAGAVIVQIAFGREVSSPNDSYISLVERSTHFFGAALVPGAYLVNIFPWLKHVPDWFPGSGFKKDARVGRELSMELYRGPYTLTKEAHARGEAEPSMATRLIDSCSEKRGTLTDEDDDSIASCVSTAYAAGAGTTISVLLTFILAMTLHPEVQQRAQEEITNVIGNDRLPTLQDRERLPYVDAICSECLRWGQVTPGGIPHSSEEDGIYKGYYIPSGTAVLPVLWAMLHDPLEYPEPDNFKPERFLPNDPKSGIPRHPRKVVFGFGRRTCPGSHLAENMIFVAVATILSTVNIEKAVDEEGNTTTPKAEYVGTLVRYLKPFKCSFTPRTPKSEGLVCGAVSM